MNDDFVEGTFGAWVVLRSVEVASVYLEEVRVNIKNVVDQAPEKLEGKVNSTMNATLKLEGENVNTRMSTIENGLGKMGPWAKDLNAQTKTSPNRVIELEAQVEAMRSEIELVRQVAAGNSYSAPAMFGGLDPEVTAMLEENQVLHFTVTNRLNQIERQCGGIEFESAAGIQEWLEVDMKEGKCSVLIDCVRFFPHLYTTFIEMSDDLTRMNQVEKLVFATEAEASCVTAFTSVLHAVFWKDKQFSKPLPALA